MNSAKIKTTIVSTILALSLLTVGCSKLTSENYDKLKAGMDYEEVTQILGKADACSGAMGIKNCKWGDDKQYVDIKFAGNKVIIFSEKGLK